MFLHGDSPLLRLLEFVYGLALNQEDGHPLHCLIISTLPISIMLVTITDSNQVDTILNALQYSQRAKIQQSMIR